jgi:hypothetical protein
MAPARHLSHKVGGQWAARLPTLAGLAFCAIVLWSLIVNLMAPHYGASTYNTGWALAASAAVLAIMGGAFSAVSKVAPLATRNRWLTTLAWVAVWSVLLAVQMRVSYAVRIPPDWDSYAIFWDASGLATGAIEHVSPYFQINPNNLLLTLLLTSYFEYVLSLGFSDLSMATAFLNGIILFAGTILTYYATRMLGGRKAAAFSLIPCTALLVLSPWATTFYSDTTSVLFTSLILCLLVRARRTNKATVRILLWVLAGFAAAVGYGIKATVIICLVAAAITALCLLPARKSAASLLLGIMIVGGSFYGGHKLIAHMERNNSAVNFDLQSNPVAMNPGHFLKVGSQSTQGPYGRFYGAYNQRDYLDTVTVKGSEAKLRAGLAVYADRVSDMGPLGYTAFLNNKLAWVMGDGSFFTWGEGRVTSDNFISQQPSDQAIQDLFGNKRPNHQWMMSIWQGTWFVVLALVAAPLLLRTRSLMRPEVSAIRIALLGLIVFLMLFEARARFLYLYAPYFIVLASLSYPVLVEVVGRRCRVRYGRNTEAGLARHPAGLPRLTR